MEGWAHVRYSFWGIYVDIEIWNISLFPWLEHDFARQIEVSPYDNYLRGKIQHNSIKTDSEAG